MKRQFSNYIENLDEWITREVNISAVTLVSDLGFKQLNDILLFKHFPECVEGLKQSQYEQDHRIMEYHTLAQYEWFETFSPAIYQSIVTDKLTALPERQFLSFIDKPYKEVLFQNLVIIALTVERWGQLILRKPPGSSIRSVWVNNNVLSLHDYLCSFNSTYNTLSTFAMTFTSSVNGMFYPKGGQLGQGIGEIICNSSYYEYDRLKNFHKTRFPSILNVDTFLSFMKKCELVSYGYNAAFLELSKALTISGVNDEIVITKVKEIIALFNIAISEFRGFMKDRSFNEQKFIFLIRQLTVELSESPAAFIFKNAEFKREEKIRIKGFLDHFLMRVEMNVNERLLFIQQLLENENIVDESIFLEIKRSVLTSQEFDKSINLSEKFKGFNLSISQEIFVACINELMTSNYIGTARIKYSLSLLKKIIPHWKETIETWINNNNWLEDFAKNLRHVDYKVAPSGANSMAFYGPDIMLGYAQRIPNYRIHMLNRLNVMSENDKNWFWQFQKNRENNIETLVRQKWQEILGEDIFDSDHSYERKSLALTQFPFLALYIDLFESYSTLALLHNSSIERYLRRVNRGMTENAKAKLINSPDHGTTYMQPTAKDDCLTLSIELPALDKMSMVRTKHLFSNWIEALDNLNNEAKEKLLSKALSPVESSLVFF